MFPLRLSLPVLTAVSLVPLPAAPSESASSPWEQTARGLLKEAHSAFASHPSPDREARFGEAVTLINLQPKTDGNLDRATALFSAIAATGADDHLGLSSRYFLARIPHVHRASQDLPAALAMYRELAALDSPHPLAQRALVQLALLELFEPRLPVERARERFDRLAARGAALTDPPSIRDFHLVMGDAALRLNLGDGIALGHLLAADRAGIARAITQRDSWVRIAGLASRCGRHDIAADYYNRFLQTFPRDTRRLMIRERLAALADRTRHDSLPAAR